MTVEAKYLESDDQANLVAAADLSPGEVIQLPDGRAGFVLGLNTRAAGQHAAIQTEDVAIIAKTAGIVFLDGCEVWWDHSANAAILRPALPGDQDFYVGTAYGDAASADTTLKVTLNIEQANIIDLHESAFDHVPVLTAGTPDLKMTGGTARAALDATNEAQKLDLLSKRSFPVASNWILEAIVEVVTNAGADVVDLNVGVANGTHASDADSITEACFIHLDLDGSLNILAESRDGTTTVAATDTTIDWAAGTPFHLMIDGRDQADIQIFINGVNVLPATVFRLDNAAGPLKALFHVEKSAAAQAAVVNCDHLVVRLMEQSLAG